MLRVVCCVAATELELSTHPHPANWISEGSQLSLHAVLEKHAEQTIRREPTEPSIKKSKSEAKRSESKSKSKLGRGRGVGGSIMLDTPHQADPWVDPVRRAWPGLCPNTHPTNQPTHPGPRARCG